MLGPEEVACNKVSKQLSCSILNLIDLHLACMTIRQQIYWNIQSVYMQSSPYMTRIIYSLAFYGGGEEPVPGSQQ
jgi:hypothetical protein